MNEKLPYDDAFLNKLQELPVANEDASWAAMERMLDKEDNEKPVPPPYFRNCGCMGALLLLILLIGGFLLVDPANWFLGKKQKDVSNEKDSTIINTNSSNQTGNVDTSKTGKININTANIELIPGAIKNVANEFNDTLSITNNKNSFSINNRVPVKLESMKTGNQSRSVLINTTIRTANKSYRKRKPFISQSPAKTKSNVTNDVAEESEENFSSKQLTIIDNQLTEIGDSVSVVTKQSTAFEDTSRKKLVDTLLNKTDTTKVPTKKKKFYVSAGLGMFQLIPIAGQKSNPYNASGRKSSMDDYIPSVFVRLYKNKKWFIQGEFRYGAPQYNKDILYYQKGILDTSTGLVISTNNRVQKTFYHQLPISFNYFLAPGFTLGAGFTFNKFSTAIIQRKVYMGNPSSQVDSFISSGTFNQKKADSNFVNTFLQAQVEMQYNWKRFSAGARYSFGLQPYLKFQLPGGGQSKESNRSLQLFLRYDLWQSRK